MATDARLIGSILRSRTESPELVDAMFYSPERIKRLLAEFAHLKHPELGPQVLYELAKVKPSKRAVGGAHFETARAVVVDLEREIEALPWFTRQIVHRHWILKESQQHIADILRCDRDTVRCHAHDGVELMSYRLGYRGPLRRKNVARAEASPTSWRHPDLERTS